MNRTLCVYCNGPKIEAAHKRSDGNVVLRCQDCALLFLDVSYDNLEAFYQHDYYDKQSDSATDGSSSSIGYSGYAQRGPFEFRWQQAFTRIFGLYPHQNSPARSKSRRKAPFRLLDVGCADGSFLGFCRDDGFSVEGIELVTVAADRARQRGFQVQCVSLDGFAPEQTYDVVTAWDVIEHLADLRAGFAKIDSLLSDGGVFLFSTPDAGAPEVLAEGDDWIGYRSSHEHLTFLHSQFLQNSLKVAFDCEPLMVSFVYRSGNETYSTLLGMVRKGGLRPDDRAQMDSLQQRLLVQQEQIRQEQLWLYVQFQQRTVESLTDSMISSPIELAALRGWAFHLANDPARAVEHLEIAAQTHRDLWQMVAFERMRLCNLANDNVALVESQVRSQIKQLEVRVEAQQQTIAMQEMQWNTAMQSVTWKLGRAITSRVERIPFSHQALGVAQVLRSDGLDGLLGASLHRAEKAIRASVPDLKQLPYLSPKMHERVKDAPMVFVFLPSVEWHLTLFQRPQHLARVLAQMGYLVIYDETGIGNPRDYSSDDRAGFHELEPNLFLFSGAPLLLTEIPNAVLWAFTYNYHLRAPYPQSTRVIYDWIDDLTVFPHDQAFLAANHARALETADVVFSVARVLHQKAQAARPDAVYLPNGVEFDRFDLPEGSPLPIDAEFQAIIDQKKPIAGYYGALASWFDYKLLDEVAKQRPDWNFVLIGVRFDDTLSQSNLLARSNVYYLGPRPYERLPLYLNQFAVALIPFLVNEITLATSPLKLYEYFAGGKATITSAMPECMAYDPVLITHNAEEFCSQLDIARKRGTDPAYRAQVRQLALENTWKARAELAVATVQALPTKLAPIQSHSSSLKEQILRSLYSGIHVLEQRLPHPRN